MAAITVIKGLEAAIPAGIKFIKAVPEMKVGIAIAINTDILNSGAVKVVKTMAKEAGEHVDAIKSFITDLPSDSLAIAKLNTAGTAVEDTRKISTATESLVAESKAAELSSNVVVRAKEAAKNQNFTPLSDNRLTRLSKTDWRVSPRNNSNGFVVNTAKLPESSGMAAVQGSLPKPGPKMEVTEKQLEQIERINPNAHGIDEHVAKTNSELVTQMKPVIDGGQGKNVASTYKDKQTYLQQVNSMLKDNYVDIEKWLKNPASTRIEIKSTNQNEYLGRILDKSGDTYTKIAQDSIFVLDKNPDGSGYHILTNYVVGKPLPN